MLPESERDWVNRRRVLQQSALLGAAALTPAFAGQSQITSKMQRMSDEISADEIQSLLGLEPNATCGFVRVTYLSKQAIAPGGLPAPFAMFRPFMSGSARGRRFLLLHHTRRRRAGPAQASLTRRVRPASARRPARPCSPCRRR